MMSNIILLPSEDYAKRWRGLAFGGQPKMYQLTFDDEQLKVGHTDGMLTSSARRVLQEFFQSGSWPHWAMVREEFGRRTISFLGSETDAFDHGPSPAEVVAVIRYALQTPLPQYDYFIPQAAKAEGLDLTGLKTG